MVSDGQLVLIFTIIIAVILVFLIIRSILLWYWKIDKIVENQQQQNKLLELIFLQLGGEKEQEETHEESNKYSDLIK